MYGLIGLLFIIVPSTFAGDLGHLGFVPQFHRDLPSVQPPPEGSISAPRRHRV
jgi:hypothetical protein